MTANNGLHSLRYIQHYMTRNSGSRGPICIEATADAFDIRVLLIISASEFRPHSLNS